jgi:hypothetical protein
MSINELHSSRSVLAGLLFYLLTASLVFAASAPMTVSQLALYQGVDREKSSSKVPRRKGFYPLTHTWFRTIAKEFGKIPFIKVSEFRTDGRNLIKRALEEISAGQYIADVIATTSEQAAIMKREGVFQEYTWQTRVITPMTSKRKGKMASTISDTMRPITAWDSTRRWFPRRKRRKP